MIAACAAVAAAQVGEPRVGTMIAGDGSARVVAGFGGAFVVAESLGEGVLDAADSSKLLVLKRAESVVVNGVEFDAPPGRAVFGFSADGLTAFAFFASNASWARVSPAGIQPLPLASLQGDVVALSGSTLYVRRSDGLHALRIRQQDGAVESDFALGLDSAMAAADGDRLIYTSDTGLMLRSADGVQRTIDAPGPVDGLFLMGPGWVQVQIGGRNFALSVSSKTGVLYELPAI